MKGGMRGLITEGMEFWLEDPRPASEPRLACPLDRRSDCRFTVVQGEPRLELGPLCSLRLLFRALSPGCAESSLWMDTGSSSFWYGGRRAALSNEEFVIVAILALARGEPVPHHAVAATLWGDTIPDRFAEVIQAHLRRVCRKFREAGIPNLVVHTSQGISLLPKVAVPG
jgi:hypothetical protein